jgi:hypothetical protein
VLELVRRDEIGMRCQQYLWLLLNGFGHAQAIWIVNDLRARHWIGFLIAKSGVLMVLGAAMARERLTGEDGSAVPSGGNLVLGDSRNDDVFVDGLGSCHLFPTLPVLREGLAGEHDRLDGRTVRLGGVIYAVEGDLRCEAARDAWATLVAASSISPISSSTAVIAVSAVAAAGDLLGSTGDRVGRGDGSGFIYDGAGGGVDVKGIVIARFAGSFFGSVVRLSVGHCTLRRFVALAWSTTAAAATAATPATATVRTRCAFAKIGSVGGVDRHGALNGDERGRPFEIRSNGA